MYRKNEDYPLYKLPEIKNLWDMMVKKTIIMPESVAFAWFENDRIKRITYREFEEDVCKTVTKLHHVGIQNSNIGIMGRNSYRWLVLFMAILYSGNTALVLDHDMDQEEFRDLIQRMDISRVFMDTGCLSKNLSELEACGAALISYDHSCDENESFFGLEDNGKTGSDGTFSPDCIDNNTVACIFLTSGTTGKRKGVMLTHANIAADINGSCRLFELKGDTLAVLPFHHAFGLIVAVWMVFNYGHTVHISQGLKRIRKELTLVKPQTMMLVPAFVESFYKMIVMSSVRNNAAGSSMDSTGRTFLGGMLEYIICGGAPLDKQYVQKYRSFGIEILNGYGTTECSPVAAVNRNGYHKDGTVGIALPDTRVTVSDDGEILIAGSHVMKGYLNDPEGTAEVLRGGWYYTGDLGFIDEDGFITLTGRKNNLVILSSGENISPEELEGKLLRIKDIEEVVVSAGERGLIAEIYTKGGCDKTSKSIKAEINALNTTLPMYKRIIDVFFREQPFRKTTSGKIIRRAYDVGKNKVNS